ncbi:hypothetical protein L917_21497 [Phytophthora nicotianae]|uniref:Uncharacterized protein n=1 Tax=Phytophthora nicotianae TaxID=4792 RepID=W2IN88_PHYNI|nr:hypothetical protein L916_12961 [Phytophthora nicotianae]ETL77562.1 hypothetical protein L917_21497 [Phytophthora nicotianae]
MDVHLTEQCQYPGGSTMEPPSFFSKYSILLMRAKKSFGG